MKPLTILFDADDVVEDLCGRWVRYLNGLYGTSVSPEDISEWDISKFFPTLRREQVYGVLGNESMWKGIEPIPGAAEVLGRFREEGHQLYMVTATDYRTPKVKFDRIFEFLPWLKWDHVIMTANKQMVKGDILIDDGPHNLLGGEYQPILFDRPHNRSYNNSSHLIPRAHTWEEVEKDVRFKIRQRERIEQTERDIAFTNMLVADYLRTGCDSYGRNQTRWS